MSLGVAPDTRTDVYPAIEASNFVGALKDKVAFVTGAGKHDTSIKLIVNLTTITGRGIGRAIALAFAQSGAHVALLSRTKSELDEVAEIIKTKFNRKALVFAVDATDNNAVADAFTQTENQLGNLDIVVPNAATGSWRPFAYLDFDDWWKVMELNVKAPLFLTQLAIKSMRERGEGTVIAISSAAGIRNVGALFINFVFIIRLNSFVQRGCRPMPHRSKALLRLSFPCQTSSEYACRAALNRAIGCLQLELDAEGKSGVHLYAVHPGECAYLFLRRFLMHFAGGVKTQLALDFSNIHEDMEKMTPGVRARNLILFSTLIQSRTKSKPS